MMGLWSGCSFSAGKEDLGHHTPGRPSSDGLDDVDGERTDLPVFRQHGQLLLRERLMGRLTHHDHLLVRVVGLQLDDVGTEVL